MKKLNSFVLIVIFTISTFHVLGQGKQTTILLENEIRIGYNKMVEYQNILDIFKQNVFILSYDKTDIYINRKRVDTLYNYDIVSKGLVDKKAIHYDILPDSIVNLNAIITAFKVNNKYLLIALGNRLLVYNQVNNDYCLKDIVFARDCMIYGISFIDENSIVVSSCLPNSKGAFPVCKINLITSSVENYKSYYYKNSFLGILGGSNFVSTTPTKTVIADPSSYKLLIVDNAKFDTIDTISLFSLRNEIPDSFSFKYKNKDDLLSLSSLRKNYFSILKVAFVSDSLIMVIKSDSEKPSNRRLIDIWSLDKYTWSIVIKDMNMNEYRGDSDLVFSKANPPYPFASDFPNLVFNNKGEIYLMQVYIDLNNSEGKTFDEILDIYNKQGFSPTREYAISKYKVSIK